MPIYLIELYSPFTLKRFYLRVEAPTAELAKDKLLYKKVKMPDGTVKIEPNIITDPDGFQFEGEDHFVVGVYPAKIMPPPPYELMPEEEVKEAEWLKPAQIITPLAKGSTPKGTPKMETPIPDSLTTIPFVQEVRSRAIRFLEDIPSFKVGIKEYGPYKAGDREYNLPWSKAKELVAVKFKVLKSPPLSPLIDPNGKVLREGEEIVYSEPEELSWAKTQTLKGNLQQITVPVAEWLYPQYKGIVKYRFDIYTKFLEEAKRMREAGKIKEAILYLIEHAPGIPLAYIPQILEVGYWTCWRAVAEYARPEEAEIKKLMEALSDAATLEKWTETQKDEIIMELKKTKEPKVVLDYRLGRVFCYPYKPKTEEELFNELKRILTLEHYPLMTPEEEEEMRKQIHTYWEKKRRETILYWVSQTKAKP
jgi:hypothetical protein